MKPSFDSSSTKLYPSQLVVPHASLKAIRIPTYVWVVMTILALTLLAVAAIYRERDGLRQARNAYQFTQQKWESTQFNNNVLRHSIHSLQPGKEVATRTAQAKLNYVRPNEVVVKVR